MPNHVTNIITYEGDRKQIAEMLEPIKNDEFGIGTLDFNKIIPMPADFFRGPLGEKEMKQYSKNNWYDWSLGNWGTKWNAEPYNAQKLRNLVNIVASKEDMIYDALQVGMSRAHYCKKVDRSFLQKLNAAKPRTMDEIKDIWYNGRDGSNYHYHDSRYHLLNLHSVFSKGTVEFRAFNSTLHAGVIRSYLVFCLAISNQALSQKSAQWKPTHSPNQKYTFRTWLLRLGLIGEEFKNCRKHLLSHLEGNIAWLHPEDAIAQRERLKQERIAARSQQREQQAPCEPAVAAVCDVQEEVRETTHENLQGVVSDCEEFDETEEMSMSM